MSVTGTNMNSAHGMPTGGEPNDTDDDAIDWKALADARRITVRLR